MRQEQAIQREYRNTWRKESLLLLVVAGFCANLTILLGDYSTLGKFFSILIVTYFILGGTIYLSRDGVVGVFTTLLVLACSLLSSKVVVLLL